MPQMKPLLWVFLMMTATLIMLTYMSFIHFFPLKLLKLLYEKKSFNKPKIIIWTW